MKRQYYTGEPCPHFPQRFKTEAAHVARYAQQRAYEARKRAKRPVRVFESDGYPLRLKLQRILANVKYRCTEARPRYGGRGIQCRITFDDLLFVWHRDGAESMARPSLDRVDNDGHYERSNIRFRELYDNISDGTKVRSQIHHASESTASEG